MQTLIVLFLVVFYTVVGVAIILGLSYAFGRYLNSRFGEKADSADTNPCAQCNADNVWYQALPGWQQSAAMAWWWVNRLQCSRKGC